MASYDPTLVSLMESDVSMETKLKRAFGRAELQYEIPAILAVEV